METLTLQVPRETLRRLEIMGFMNDLNGRDVICFLIEQGLAVLEKHRRRGEYTFQQPSSGATPKAAA
jgi:hypothetical protein